MTNHKHLLSNLWLVLCQGLLLVSSTSLTLPSTQLRGFTWVLAPPPSSHAAACRLIELYPTRPRDDVPWGEDVLAEVVGGMGRQLLGANTSHGLAGCCAPGLWCLPGDDGPCYTHSLAEQFVNVELSGQVNVSSIYSCTDMALNESMITGSLAYDYEGEGAQSQVVVSGSSFGLDRDAMEVTLNGATCSDVDLCHSVCQACTTSPNSCPTGSICLGVSSQYSCFPYCAGPEDLSCPCSSSCVLISIQITQTSYLPTHLCAPDHLSCDQYTPTSIFDDSHLTCHAPSVYSQVFEGEEWLNNVQEATVSVAHDAIVMTAALSPLRCTADADCFDQDAYTSDTCSELGVCTYVRKENITVAASDPERGASEVAMAASHSSTLSHIRDRATPYTYVWFQLSEQEMVQDSFQSDVERDGTRSPVSDVDDHPVDYFDLDFTFNYFGSLWTEVSVNPNGVLSFPPYSHCWGMISGLGCPVYRTSTNTLSVWGHDWDPSRALASSVYTLKQRRVDGEEVFNSSSSNAIGGVNANAFHVMYSDVEKYDSDAAAPIFQNSFSASLYEDGSIRLRYHNATIAVEEGDVFGLWGSRAASSSSPLLRHDSSSTRYHQEALNGSALVRAEGGQDVVFCSLDTLACMSHTCTSAGGQASFSLLGREPSCLAAAGGMQVWCVWAGGLALSSPTFSPSLDTNHTLVQCPTPSLDIANNSLISLDLRLAVDESQASSPMHAGKKSIFTKYMDSSTGEVVNGHLMVRYFSALSSGGEEEGCGCDAISSSALDAYCDSCLVCGTVATSEGDEGSGGMRDCHGDCHGTAYEDSCGTCAGGASGQHPISSCDFPDDITGEDEMNNISKTILFIVLMICMTFMFTACLRIIRTSVSIQEQEQEALRVRGQVQQLHERPAPLRRGNGLSGFEIDSLGADTFGVIKCSDLESGDCSVYGARASVANLECAICLSDFADSALCRQLPCEHVFHQSCIDEWFILSVKCPMCKRNIRDIILGEEMVPARRRVESAEEIREGGGDTLAAPPSSSSVTRTSSDDGSDGGVENPLIVSDVEMTSSHL